MAFLERYRRVKRSLLHGKSKAEDDRDQLIASLSLQEDAIRLAEQAKEVAWKESRSYKEIQAIIQSQEMRDALLRYYEMLVQRNRSDSQHSRWSISRIEVSSFDPSGHLSHWNSKTDGSGETDWGVDINLEYRWFARRRKGIIGSEEIDVAAGTGVHHPLSLRIRATDQEGIFQITRDLFSYDEYERGRTQISTETIKFASTDELLDSIAESIASWEIIRENYRQ